MPKLSTIVLCAALFNAPIFAQDAVLRVYADQQHQAHVVCRNGKTIIVPRENGQVGIESSELAEDGQTAGWLVLYADPDGGSPFAGTLVLWRSGKVVRRFQADQTFWSWAFYAQAEQVAYHVGPTHGETKSHCELHDVTTGRLLQSWDGDLDDSHRPPWTRALHH